VNEEASKKTLLVVIVKGNDAEEIQRLIDLIKHGGPDVIIQTDEYVCRSLKLYFKEDSICEAVNDILEKKGYFLKFQRTYDRPTLLAFTGQINIGTLFAHLLNHIQEAGFIVLAADSTRVSQPIEVLRVGG
jgi:hypothetical protein